MRDGTVVPTLAVAQLRVTSRRRRLGGVAIAEWGLMSQIDRAKGHTWGSDLRDRESLKAEGRRFDSASDHSIPGICDASYSVAGAISSSSTKRPSLQFRGSFQAECDLI